VNGIFPCQRESRSVRCGDDGKTIEARSKRVMACQGRRLDGGKSNRRVAQQCSCDVRSISKNKVLALMLPVLQT